MSDLSRLHIPVSALVMAVTHAAGEADREVCGLFVKPADGSDALIEYQACENEADDTRRSFVIGTSQLVSVVDAGKEIACIFHSHPHGELRPSVRDYTSFPKHYTDHGLIYVSGWKRVEDEAGGNLIHYDETGIYEIVYGVDKVKGLIWDS